MRPLVLSLACLATFAGLAPAAAQAQADPRKAPAADVRKSGTVLELQQDAPDRYTVQRGDTLWSISNRFLKEPWRWPEFWRFNSDQIGNPHLIYPGQVIVIDRVNRRATVAGTDDRLRPRIRVEDGPGGAIPTIPSNVIEPWLTRPLVIERGGLDSAPRIVATEEGRYTAGPGARIYVKGIPANNEERLWNVYRQGRPLVDPETREVLGIEAIYVGAARYVRAGDPATLTITTAQIEVTPGDRLVPAEKVKLVQYAPRAPEKEVNARLMGVYGGRGEENDFASSIDGARLDVANYDNRREAGPLQVLSINKGTRDGLEVGHVLALHRSQLIAHDRSMGQYYMGKPRPADVQLPEERYGLILVFRTFDRVSYGLIVQAQRTALPGDVARKP
jgi:hypothetical protein